MKHHELRNGWTKDETWKNGKLKEKIVTQPLMLYNLWIHLEFYSSFYDTLTSWGTSSISDQKLVISLNNSSIQYSLKDVVTSHLIYPLQFSTGISHV